MKKINNGKILKISIFTISLFLLAEVIGGIMANSLALLSDAGHMLSDFFALLLSLIAHKYSNKPADNKKTFGYVRMEIIASFINGITLIGISIVISVAGIIRLFNHTEVESNIMIIVAVAGIIVNSFILFTLHKAENKNLNIKGSIIHILGDLLGFISTAIGGLIIKMTDWHIIDPILSILISLLIFNSAFRLVKASLHILMEGSPQHLSESDLKENLIKIDGVIAVQHIHIWQLTDDYTIATLHIIIDKDEDGLEVTKNAKKIINELGIQHSTIEIDENIKEAC